MNIPKTDYSDLDRPEVLSFLFHPRPEMPGLNSSNAILIPVADNIVIGAQFHIVHAEAPSILFFHGNGEIVADYDDLSKLYNQLGINFFPVDYRGYGRSNGTPSVSSMMGDCHIIFRYIKDWMTEHHLSGPFVVMGRSLGSASALELAHAHQNQLDALIIESGFARDLPLLKLLGADTSDLGLTEEKGFGNADKIRSFLKPTLVIHAEHDHIIPFSEGRMLYDTCSSDEKIFLKIPSANHNNIFQVGLEMYLAKIVKFLNDLK